MSVPPGRLDSGRVLSFYDCLFCAVGLTDTNTEPHSRDTERFLSHAAKLLFKLSCKQIAALHTQAEL